MINWEVINYKKDITDNCITDITWRCTVSNETYSITMESSCIISRHEPFIAIENITVSMMIDWVKEQIDSLTIENDLNKQLDVKTNPQYIIETL
jgi:hypothetical protein